MTVQPMTVEPTTVDPSGRRFLLIGFGAEAAETVEGWGGAAAELGPVATLVASDHDPAAVEAALAASRCGVRIMVAGPRDAVLLTLAAAREAGAEPEELRSAVTRADALALYCAHCRATSRVVAEPGGLATCPSCAVLLDVHEHFSAVRGSFLGSDARARDIA